VETFVVRIWTPADAAEVEPTTGDVRGRLEHVTSGRGAPFHGTVELGTLILRELRRSDRRAGRPEEKEE
jgi:hypothetical protein